MLDFMNKSKSKGLGTLTSEFRATGDHSALPPYSAWVRLCYFCPALPLKGVLENFRFVEGGVGSRGDKTKSIEALKGREDQNYSAGLMKVR